jgi:p-aminobenzoyl-glutamate transporter AbgT
VRSIHNVLLAISLAAVLLAVVMVAIRVYSEIIEPQVREWKQARQQKKEAHERMDKVINLNKHKRERKL